MTHVQVGAVWTNQQGVLATHTCNMTQGQLLVQARMLGDTRVWEELQTEKGGYRVKTETRPHQSIKAMGSNN